MQFRSGKDAVLYLGIPDGVSRESRRLLLDRLRDLHAHAAEQLATVRFDGRIAQYEMSYRMQASVPGVMDVSTESEETFELYGPDSRKPGTFAANCLLAAGSPSAGKFVQLYHQGWDQHDNLPRDIERQCRGNGSGERRAADRPQASRPARRHAGHLGRNSGRTSYSQGKLTATNYGRDHHPRCFSVWMAGGGAKPGLVYGATDDFSSNVNRTPRPRSRFPRHPAAPARRRPRAPDLPLSGPPVPLDRRPRQSRRRPAAPDPGQTGARRQVRRAVYPHCTLH